MRRETKTVWTSDDGKIELLIKKADDSFVVPTYSLTAGQLLELGEAIEDAIPEPKHGKVFLSKAVAA